MNVIPTAEAIIKNAETLRHYATELERIAENMRTRQDITYAAEALGAITNCMGSLRLDLLVTRPLREYNKKTS